MLDPITMSMKMQNAALAGTFFASSLALGNFVRMMQQGGQLMGPQGLPFLGSDRRHHPWKLFRGANLLDHYGRRHLDVDVEHMR
ncbi:MAG: hypothetical protein KDE22_04030 [Rhodobacterales bacterium]|nr:hypothetical protein [Rhodobacterales bacterium]